MNNFSFDTGRDGLAVIRIDVPQRPLNVIDVLFIDELQQCIERVVAAPEISGAILTSGKPGSFVAGADIQMFLRAAEAGITPQAGAALVRRIAQVYRRIETCGKPFVAAINGLALGGGLELALACHHRVLADDPKAVVGQPEVKLGLLPGAGGTQRLPRLIGIERALPLLLDGRAIAPAQAVSLGIVDRLVPPGEVLDAARAWLLATPNAQAPWDRKGFAIPGGAGPLAMPARDLFGNGIAGVLRRGGPQQAAALAILSCVYEGTITAFDAGLRIESKYFGMLLSRPQARELMQAFLHKAASPDSAGLR